MGTFQTFLVFMLLIVHSSAQSDFSSWPFSSSLENAQKAAKNYPDSPVQRYVATSFGDEIPNMRDDLINRKNSGEGFFERHFKAWTTGSNWEVDENNDAKEEANPANP